MAKSIQSQPELGSAVGARLTALQKTNLLQIAQLTKEAFGEAEVVITTSKKGNHVEVSQLIAEQAPSTRSVRASVDNKHNNSNSMAVDFDELKNTIGERLKNLGLPKDDISSLVRFCEVPLALCLKAKRRSERGEAIKDSELITSVIHFLCDVHVGLRADHSKISKTFISAADPFLYVQHKHEYETAEAFLRAAYKGRLGIEGNLDQAMLRKGDPFLMAQLDLEFKGPARREALRKLVPTATDRNDQRLLDALGYMPEGQERQVALNALNRGYKPKIRR